MNVPNLFVAFLDEVNTADILGLASQLICTKIFMGQCLPSDFVVVAACNPYTARADNTLKYGVRKLPETLLKDTYDFGALSVETEKVYIAKQLEVLLKYFRTEPTCLLESLVGLLSALICAAQEFLRSLMDDRAAASLRDVDTTEHPPRAQYFAEPWWSRCSTPTPCGSKSTTAKTLWKSGQLLAPTHR